MSAGKLLAPYLMGKTAETVVVKQVSGPSSYPSGGFTVTIPELTNIKEVAVIPNPSQILEADDTVYSISWTVSGNSVTIVIKTLNVTASSPVSWTELGAVDLSGVTFTIIATGE